MKCIKCDKQHDGKYGSGKFCSIFCANSRPKSKEVKEKISKKLKGKEPSNKGKEMVPRENRNCPTCTKEFRVTCKSLKKYCSGKCNPLHGGYRKNSGRAKTGYYKEIYCGSTYELAWVIYQLDHEIAFDRFEGVIQEGNKKYFPDFIIDNTIYEMKGFESEESVEIKTKLAESKGYTVKVLRKSDLIKEFEWVKTNYKFKHMEELYDNYKPKFSYTCSNCSSIIERRKKVKTNTKFCSQSCTGKYRTKIKYGAMV